MSDITRKNLARGTKLTRQHVFTPLSAAALELSTTSIDRENMLDNWGSFRVNFHVPILDAKYFINAGNGAVRFSMPFTLPPLQEHFIDTGIPAANTPLLVLEEFQMSFDQRSEASAIASRTQAATSINAGKLFPDALDRLDFSVALLEKQQWFFDNTTPNEPEAEIFSTDLPAELWGGRELRLNPVIVTELNKTISPYRTYILSLDAQDIFSTDEKVALPALNFSLKIYYPLTFRDSGVNYVQNIPTVHAGNKSSPSVTINTPTTGSIISADANSGVQTNLKTIDNILQSKLRGGYGKDSDVPPTEHITDDACYEVICAPLWSGYGHEGVITAGYAPDIPEASGGVPYVGVQQDEISIPLAWPMTIHHVVLARNFQAPSSGTTGAFGGKHPTSATFAQAVSVGIGSGRRSDVHTYQDIATVTWDTTNKDAITIDKVLGIRNSLATGEVLGSTERYDWELLSCPLVTGSQGAGAGYYAQGTPFFVGTASSKMWERSDVGNGNAGAPFTEGAEQFLQVNWRFEDPLGLDTAANGGAAATTAEVYVGYSGHWVQIIGKKHLVGLEDEITI